MIPHFRRQQSLLDLNLDVATIPKERLSSERALTYADLYALLGDQNAVTLLTPHAAVARCG
jgi:hypothetical protein